MLFGKQKLSQVTMEEDGPQASLDPQDLPAFEKTKEEKRFLMKLDIFLLTFGCVS